MEITDLVTFRYITDINLNEDDYSIEVCYNNGYTKKYLYKEIISVTFIFDKIKEIRFLEKESGDVLSCY